MQEYIEESLVQWILSKNPEYLAGILDHPLGRCLGTEVTTKFGRLDFIFEYPEGDMGNIILIELETGINNSSKFEHTTSQLTRYLNLRSGFTSKNVIVALLYAKEGTTEDYKIKLQEFSTKNGIIIKDYSMLKLLQMYDEMLNQLHRTSGVSLGRAVALGITSISWLNKFLIAFCNGHGYEDQFDNIYWKDLKDKFSSNTNFYVLKRLAEDFEMIYIINTRKGKEVVLTEVGIRFRNELATQLQLQDLNDQASNTVDLTLSQKQLIIEILINGNFTKIKVNIFHFLRFVHLTEGSWLPKQNTKLTKAEQQYLNNTFRTSYNSRTLKDIVQQTFTFCEELGLLEKAPMPNQVHDKVVFTTLGSRVYHYFEQLLNVERERHQIPQQIRS